MIIGGVILVHPPPEKRGQRQTKMVCLCGIATQKNLLSEFEILGTVKIKTGPSMNIAALSSGDIPAGVHITSEPSLLTASPDHH